MKIPLHTVLFGALFTLFMGSDLTWADIFKCTRPDGSVFFAGDPSQVPKGCVIERVQGLPPLGTLPGLPVKQPPVPAVNSAISQKAQNGKNESVAVFKGEATQLVERFRAARHGVIRSSYVADKLKARRELTDIKAQANNLRDEISRSSLRSSEKQELNSLLSPIGE